MRPALQDAAIDIRPWYRQAWPWLVILPPAVAVVAGIWTVVIAYTNPDSLVIDDFQKVGLVANRVTARDRAAETLGVAANVAIDHSTGNVTVKLAGEDVEVTALLISLHHPTQPGLDVTARLGRDSSGLYRGNIGAVAMHRWYLQLQDAPGHWRLTGELQEGQSLLEFSSTKSDE